MTRAWRPAVAYPRDLEQEDQHFNSGINDKGEVRGVMGSGRHVGITASCMRPGMLRELSTGRYGLTRLFVDSGAFSEVKFGPYRVVKEITHEEWQRRFRLYRWAAATYRERAYVVAPDRVGDQDVTLERLARYALDVAWCASFGANVIVPVQKGTLSMGEFFQLASNILRLRTSPIAGIPMQKDATSIDDLREFCETLPWFGARIHLLGIGPKAKLRRFWKAIETIKSVRPNCQVTSDSALVPSLVGRTNGPGGGPRILTALQDEARKLGLQGHETKRYGLMKQGFAEIDADRVRAEDAGWFDEELYDSVDEARAHRLAGYPDDLGGRRDEVSPQATPKDDIATPSPARFFQLVLPLTALMAAAGCDQVFGLHRPPAADAATVDGATDATANSDALHDTATPDAQLPSEIVFTFGGTSVCVDKLAAGSVFLRNSPTSTVTVTITSAIPAQLSIDAPQVFTFDNTNWNLARTIVSRGVAVSTGPITITASTPNDNPVTDGLTVIPPC